MKWLFWAGLLATVPIGYALVLALLEDPEDRVRFALGWLLFLPLAYWLGVVLEGGLTWAWAAGVVEVALLSSTLIWRFRTGAWKHIVI